MFKNRRGFTVVELLVVMAIVSVLSTVTVCGYNKFIDKANSVQSIVDAYDDKLLSALGTPEEVQVDAVSAPVYVSTIDMIPEDLRSDEEATVVVSNNILYVVGSGDMTDYTLSKLPEYKSNEITTIIVQDGITSIGEFAFYNMTGVEEVYFPSTVVEIGHYAFYKCTNLISINTDDLMKICKYAFYGCQGLTFTTDAYCEAAALEFLGDDQSAFPRSLAKVEAMKAYLNEVYLGKYPALGFDIDYCSADDIELLTALANKITAGLTTNESKAEAIYDWVRTNITYGTSTNSFSAIDVYKNREGICSGYAQLTSTLFRLSGIPSAIVRCSKQGTTNIDLGTSNYYQDKKGHQFVVAYVDNDWYGYDACWGKDQPGVWSKMPAERMADQYVVLHVDGIMTYSDEAWDYTTLGCRTTNTWYIDGEFVCMTKGEITLFAGSGLQVGGCLTYTSAYWYDSCKYYYTYLGTGTNKSMQAYLGGYYYSKYFGQDILYYQENGIQENEYYTYNNETYFNGVKVNNLIPDLGLTDNQINLYIGESFDLASLYSGCTITASNTNLTISGTLITATSSGTATLSINNGTKTYEIKFYVRDYTGDSLTQELCDHDHTHTCGTDEVCSYCGKVVKTTPIITATTQKTIITSTAATKKVTLTTTASIALKSTSKKSIFKIKKK